MGAGGSHGSVRRVTGVVYAEEMKVCMSVEEEEAPAGGFGRILCNDVQAAQKVGRVLGWAVVSSRQLGETEVEYGATEVIVTAC